MEGGVFHQAEAAAHAYEAGVVLVAGLRSTWSSFSGSGRGTSWYVHIDKAVVYE